MPSPSRRGPGADVTNSRAGPGTIGDGDQDHDRAGPGTTTRRPTPGPRTTTHPQAPPSTSTRTNHRTTPRLTMH
ncbi:hypothetical protein ACIQU6_30765 [Streptomyces sp. NPDC090442]|uniref:hypothetical protein n=1 Tax=Streptomyces sp. NPDC090442 TaxID=3365962 RepID=UPI00381E9450